MNATQLAESAPPPGARRAQRAAFAHRLLEKAPDSAAALDWDMLDRVPAWLSLPPHALATLERQVGAVLCAPALRLWIDGPRIAAARSALGEAFMRALLAQPDAEALPGAPTRPRLEAAAQIGALLQTAGAGVLLATLAPGPLRRTAGSMLSSSAALFMEPALAQALVSRALAISSAAESRS